LLEEALAVQQAAGATEIHLIRPLVELAELQAQQPEMAEAAEETSSADWKFRSVSTVT
jgi:hypothetical protein